MYNLSKPCFCGGHIPIFILLIGYVSRWILFFALYCYCTVHRVMPPMHNGEVSSQADIGRRLLAETDNWYELPLNPHVYLILRDNKQTIKKTVINSAQWHQPPHNSQICYQLENVLSWSTFDIGWLQHLRHRSIEDLSLNMSAFHNNFPGKLPKGLNL